MGLAKTRILVVDDNPDILAFMRTWLELSGYEPALAHDGVEALQVADQFRPHVVLMDLAMPRMDGFEAARRLGDRPWRRSVLLVAHTAHAEDRLRAQSEAAGFDMHLTKPADPDALVAAIRDWEARVATSRVAAGAHRDDRD
jgi:CheY-like chemotaxis protein